MSLSAALNTAKSSLAATQLQTQITSSNIANVNTPGATRKVANVVTASNGAVTVTSISQSSNSVLFRNMLDATSKLQVAVAHSDAYSRINEILGSTESKESPQAKIAALNDALTTLSNTPGSNDLARTAVMAAQDLVTTIRSNAATVETLRRDADAKLALAADDMNRILASLQSINRQVVSGTGKGIDVTDESDERDRLVTQLSQYVGVSAQIRTGNDLVLYTDSGITLLENTARAVSFSPTGSLNPGEEGNSVYVDGVALTGKNAYMPAKSGMIVGLTEVRDEIANTYGAQLDELSRGLISAFSEFDPSGSGAAKMGLFTSGQNLSTTTGPIPIGSLTSTAGFSSTPNVSFTVTYEGVAYQASGTLTAADWATPAAFAGKLQSMVAAAQTSGGVALGAGRISVTSSGTGLSMAATGIGESIGFQVSGLSANLSAAGLTPVTTTGSVSVGGLNGTAALAANNTVSFTVSYEGVAYQASGTLAAADYATPAAFAQRMQAIAALATDANGNALGAGRIAIGNPSGTALSVTAIGTANTFQISGLSSNLVTSGMVAATKTPSTEPTYKGLSSTLTLASGLDATPTMIRDGVNYQYNPGGATKLGGFSGRINALTQAMNAMRSFDPTAAADPHASLASYASSSIGWVQESRTAASKQATSMATLVTKTNETLSSENGINLDVELSRLMELERSYQASAKIISTVDQMLAQLLQSI